MSCCFSLRFRKVSTPDKVRKSAMIVRINDFEKGIGGDCRDFSCWSFGCFGSI